MFSVQLNAQVGYRHHYRLGLHPQAKPQGYLVASTCSQYPQFSSTQGERAPESNLFGKLPPNRRELSMPDYAVWREFVTDRMMFQALRKANVNYLAKLNAPVDVVDIGMGYGNFLFCAAQEFYKARGNKRPNIVGVDILQTMVNFATRQAKKLDFNGMPFRKIARYKFFETDVVESKEFHYRVPNNSTALVILSSMLHMDDEANRKLIQEAERILVPGGRILITHWFRGYTPRGPEDILRPPPETLVKWAFMSPALHDFEFVGYQRLSDGMYCAVLQKPMHAKDKPGKLDHKDIDPLGQDALVQVLQPAVYISTDGYPLDKLHRVFGSLRYLHNHAEAAVFLSGLTERYIQDNPLFVQQVRNLFETNEAYRERLAERVIQMGNQMNRNPRSMAGLVERNTTLEKEVAKLFFEPEQFEVRQILLQWLDQAKMNIDTEYVIQHGHFPNLPVDDFCQHAALLAPYEVQETGQFRGWGPSEMLDSIRPLIDKQQREQRRPKPPKD